MEFTPKSKEKCTPQNNHSQKVVGVEEHIISFDKCLSSTYSVLGTEENKTKFFLLASPAGHQERSLLNKLLY